MASTSPEVRASAVGSGSVCGESDWKHGSIGEAARLIGISAELPMRGVAVVCSGETWRLMLEELRRGTQAGRETHRHTNGRTGERTHGQTETRTHGKTNGILFGHQNSCFGHTSRFLDLRGDY